MADCMQRIRGLADVLGAFFTWLGRSGQILEAVTSVLFVHLRPTCGFVRRLLPCQLVSWPRKNYLGFIVGLRINMPSQVSSIMILKLQVRRSLVRLYKGKVQDVVASRSKCLVILWEIRTSGGSIYDILVRNLRTRAEDRSVSEHSFCQTVASLHSPTIGSQLKESINDLFAETMLMSKLQIQSPLIKCAHVLPHALTRP